MMDRYLVKQLYKYYLHVGNIDLQFMEDNA